MTWADVLTAIATALIALVLLAWTVGILPLFVELKRLAARGGRLADALDRDIRPVLDSVRTISKDAGDVVSTLRSEVTGIAGTSHDLRARLVYAADSVEDRLRDLEALLDVVQDEVEETALDFAAALRTTRRGSGVFRKMKRVFLRAGR